jgi:hypothetical protein
MKITVVTEGMDELARLLVKGGAVAVAATGRALYAEANDIFNKSQAQVPVDTGALRSSGHVSLPVATPRSIEVTIGYGGAAAPYAYYVHENLEANHPKGGKAKYLEDPSNEAIGGILERVAGYVDAAIRGIK